MPRLESVLVDYLVLEKFVKPGYYVGVLFAEGPVFLKVVSREVIHYDYTLTTPLEPGVEATEADEVLDSSGRRILEPENTNYVHQVLFGIRPPCVRAYVEFPPRTRRWVLHGSVKPGNPTGYIDGYESPYDNPSIKSELWVWRDLYPGFLWYNESDEAVTPTIRFWIAKCRYKIVADRNLIRDFIEGRKRCHFWGFLEPYSIPDWLRRRLGDDLLDYAKRLWESTR